MKPFSVVVGFHGLRLTAGFVLFSALYLNFADVAVVVIVRKNMCLIDGVPFLVLLFSGYGSFFLFSIIKFDMPTRVPRIHPIILTVSIQMFLVSVFVSWFSAL